MKFANKMKALDLNIFSNWRRRKRARTPPAGHEVISLSVGTPDFRPDDPRNRAALKRSGGHSG